MVRGASRLRLRLFASALRRGGSRTALAVAAVAIGVVATMLHEAAEAGARREFEETAERVGRHLLVVTSGSVLAMPGRGRGWVPSSRLDEADAEALRSDVEELAAVTPLVEGVRRIVAAGEATSTTVRGVLPDYLALRRYDVVAGRGLDATDGDDRRRVAVAGATVANRLAGGAALVGATVRVGGVPFEIVGVLAEKGLSPDGQNEDDQILVPLDTARRRLFGRETFSRLLLQARDEPSTPAAERKARDLLRARHRITPGGRDDFEVARLVRSSEIRRRSAGFVSDLAALFAATTLVLAVAGVTAVSYLNVRDRAAEIGLRRAVGARRRDVAREVVGETLWLAATGGVAGVLSGAIVVAALSRAVAWRMAVEPAGVALAFTLSLAVGLAAGWLPARRAARIPPIEALRTH